MILSEIVQAIPRLSIHFYILSLLYMSAYYHMSPSFARPSKKECWRNATLDLTNFQPLTPSMIMRESRAPKDNDGPADKLASSTCPGHDTWKFKLERRGFQCFVDLGVCD